jgi:hypothetical protein
LATLDALLSVAGESQPLPLEVKTTSNPDGYPLEYLEAQLHAQMACCGVDRGFSAVRNLVTGELHVVEHQADPVITAAVLEMAETLWAHLCAETIPEPTFPSDADLWSRLYPQSTSAAVEIPVALFQGLVAAREEAQKAQNRADLLEAQVKEELGDSSIGMVRGAAVVVWRTVSSRRVDLKALEADAPELVEAHRKESTSRRFGIVAQERSRLSAHAPDHARTHINQERESLMGLTVENTPPLKRFAKEEHENHTAILFISPKVETGDFGFGESESAVADVICTQCQKGWEEQRIFGTKIVPRLHDAVGKIRSGILYQGKASPGRSAPWLLEDLNEDELADAQAAIDRFITVLASGKIVVDFDAVNQDWD